MYDKLTGTLMRSELTPVEGMCRKERPIELKDTFFVKLDRIDGLVIPHHIFLPK